MLVDPNYVFQNHIGKIIARLGKNRDDIIRKEKGVWELGHFNFEGCISGIKDIDPEGNFDCYGVCDNYKQIIKKFPELKTSDRKFVIAITPVRKENQSPTGGWRWHKWGRYIGKNKPKHEYLYDEPKIKLIYVFHIYELE